MWQLVPHFEEEGVLLLVSTPCHPQFCQLSLHQEVRQDQEQVHQEHHLQSQERCE
jgi:hypothetical protein